MLGFDAQGISHGKLEDNQRSLVLYCHRDVLVVRMRRDERLAHRVGNLDGRFLSTAPREYQHVSQTPAAGA